MYSTFVLTFIRVVAVVGTAAYIMMMPLFSHAQTTTASSTPTAPGFPSTGVGGDATSYLSSLGFGVLGIVLGLALFIAHRRREGRKM